MMGGAILLIIIYKLWSNSRSNGDEDKFGSGANRLGQYQNPNPKNDKDKKLDELKHKLAGMEASLGKAGLGSTRTGARESEINTRKRK